MKLSVFILFLSVFSFELKANSQVTLHVYKPGIKINYKNPGTVFPSPIKILLASFWGGLRTIAGPRHALGHMALTTQCEGENPRYYSFEAKDSDELVKTIDEGGFRVWFKSYRGQIENKHQFLRRHRNISKKISLEIKIGEEECAIINKSFTEFSSTEYLENYNLSYGQNPDQTGGVCSDLVYQILQRSKVLAKIENLTKIETKRSWVRSFAIPEELVDRPRSEIKSQKRSEQWPSVESEGIKPIHFVDPALVYGSLTAFCKNTNENDQIKCLKRDKLFYLSETNGPLIKFVATKAILNF